MKFPPRSPHPARQLPEQIPCGRFSRLFNVPQPFGEFCERLLAHGNGPERAFPDDNDVPALFGPEPLMLLVALHVAAELRVPERTVRLRHGRLRTLGGLHELAAVPLPAVAMPEAAAYLNERLQPRQDDVGMPHDALVTDAKAIAVREEPLADDNLRQRVARMNRGHDLRTLRLRELVHIPNRPARTSHRHELSRLPTVAVLQFIQPFEPHSLANIRQTGS